VNKAALTTLAGRVPLLGALLRKVARQYAEGSVVEIKQGLAAGLRWKRHHRYVNGYWIGHYELPIQEALRRELSPGQTFFDVGANAGFFTLVAARLVGAQGRCVAFDPLPGNIESLREQVELNALSQCVVVPEAVGEQPGAASFSFASAGDSQAHLGTSRRPGEQAIEVKVTTLDLAMARHGAPHYVKLDVEGAEAQVLKGAEQVLRLAKPRWLIELHGPECERDVKEILAAHGYRFFDLNGRALAAAAVLPHHFLAKPT
jgi:FkbM family methyltransferase